MTIKTLEQLQIKGKKVLIRVDYNTPIKDGEITDDTRIRASLPTLDYLLGQNCRITLMSHMGRPKGEPDPAYSLAPVAKRLAELIDRPVELVADLNQTQSDAQVRMLENLRFHPGETKNDTEFARKLAAFGEVYINDAFGAAHRAHASIDAICGFFEEKGAGMLLSRELHFLRDALREPAKPFLVILGGAKVSDKLQIIENLLPRVNQLIIGGAMSYTFLKARGVSVGISRVEEDFLEEARRIMATCEAKGIELILPLDHVAAKTFAEDAEAVITADEDIADGYMGLDIGPETIDLFTAAIRKAKTVVWNGPMGVFEWESFSTGTLSVAETAAEVEALTIVGGGDSVAAVMAAGVQDRISHISTGGGAGLELLGGVELPGVKALEV